MNYLAHKREDNITQSLKEHLENTARLAGKFAKEFEAGDWAYCAGLLHDIGKYSVEFQRRINGSNEKVDHSTAGAQLCWNMKGPYGFLSYCIAGHHAGLPDTGGKEDVESCGSLYGRLNKKIKDYSAYQNEISLPILKSMHFLPSENENDSQFASMLVRMIYSCLANSVIIFDEAQMLPNDYLKPCIFAMEQLIRHYKCSVVLCTATQPALQNLFAKDMKAKELCPRIEEQFHFFRRTVLENLGRISEEELVQRLKKEERALCILNTKKKVQKLYQHLRGEGVYHLSTSMYPEHRRRVLAKIRDRLDNDEKCIVISTSLVEAGVDLDFRNVYRQLAGTDSVIQAAGRCNRKGDRPLEESHTWIFQLEERENIPGQRQQIAVTEALLSEGRNLEEQDTIQDYFEMLYHFRGSGLDKKEILNEFLGMRFSFKKVSDMVKGFAEGLKDFYVLKNCEQYTDDMGLRLDMEYGQAVIF